MVGAGSLDLQIQPEGMGLAQPGVKIPQHLQGGYQQQGARLLRGVVAGQSNMYFLPVFSIATIDGRTTSGPKFGVSSRRGNGSVRDMM